MIGRPVVERLLAGGFEVTVGTRSPEAARKMFGGWVKAVRVVLADREEVVCALEGMDAVHLSLPSGPTFYDCFQNETGAAKNVTAVASRMGIKRISYLSGMTVNAKADFPPSEAKRRAEETIRGSGVAFTIWRPGWFMETLGKLVRYGMMVVPGRGDSPVHWLAGEDFATQVARSFTTDDAEGRVFYPMGPEALTLRQAVTIYRDIVHPGMRIMGMPFEVMELVGRLPGRREAWFAAQLMRHLEQTGEIGDSTEVNKICGAPVMTVADYANKARERLSNQVIK
jgi:NADH dehydrogenase